MAMFAERIDRETPELHEEGVRMRFVGRREGLNAELVRRMDWAEELTGGNERITLFVAFNYGGRAEIVDAARNFTGDSEEEFRRHLYAPDMHDPDLLIRTSGELRISNYLLWQLAYAEFVFRDELWPDFTREAFEASLDEYAARGRRFGGALGGGGASGSGPTSRRAMVVAIPAIIFALIIVDQGGEVFAIGIFALGVIAMGELYTLMGRVRPPALAGFLTLGRDAGRGPLRRAAARDHGARGLVPGDLRPRGAAPTAGARVLGDRRDLLRRALDRHRDGARGLAARAAARRRAPDRRARGHLPG